MIKDTPEWEVTLTNPCSCTGTDIVLTCVGFKSLTPIDRSQISVSGNECSLINNLYGQTDFVFKYVWAEEFDIKIKSGEMEGLCVIICVKICVYRVYANV
ncbi:hypothetical protein YC2023_007555 [Brassica napus]